ncbi:TPA: hypothetical protein ACWLT0_002887 [Pseudomonas aeruginosa]
MTTQADIIKPDSRIVVQFSCGAASAVAGKLTQAQYGATHDVQFLNAFLANEHDDNRRFLSDCEIWTGRSSRFCATKNTTPTCSKSSAASAT